LNVEEACSNGFQNQLFTSIETQPQKEDLLPDLDLRIYHAFVLRC